MFYKLNSKHLSHQCHPLGKNWHHFDEKIANLTNFWSQFHVKSSYTFTLNAFLCSEKNSSNISHASDNTCNYII